MRYGTLVLGLMSFVGMVSSTTVLKTSDHSTQKSFNNAVCREDRAWAGRHSSFAGCVEICIARFSCGFSSEGVCGRLIWKLEACCGQSLGMGGGLSSVRE